MALVKPPRLLLVEVKTARGHLRPEQRVWLTALAQCPGVEVAVWRPSDWPSIERVLIAGERLIGLKGDANAASEALVPSSC